MRKAILGAGFAVLAAMQTPALHAEGGRIGEIRERLENANRWRDHVMVVAHRGGGMEGSRSSHPENSIAAVRSVIDLGVEMVELDIQKSSDGEFVVFHDSWLDRSSTCKGELATRTLAEFKECRLVIAGTGEATGERIPTLREMLEVTRDRVFVNIDNKLDIEALPDIVAVAREMGMADQIVIKQNLWNAEKIAEMARVLEETGRGCDLHADHRRRCREGPEVPGGRDPYLFGRCGGIDRLAQGWRTDDRQTAVRCSARRRGRWPPAATGISGSTPTPSSTNQAACCRAVAAISSRLPRVCPARRTASGSNAARPSSRPTSLRPRSSG